jgi:hypothetical protein
VFGDLLDGASRLAQWNANPRRFHVLAELGTRPSVSYLGKPRDPGNDGGAA